MSSLLSRVARLAGWALPVLVASSAAFGAAPAFNWAVTFSQSWGGTDIYYASCTDQAGRTFVLVDSRGDRVISYDSNGNLLSNNELTSTLWVDYSGMGVDAGGNYCVVGTVFAGHMSVHAAKFQPSGAVLWGNGYYSATYYYVEPSSLAVDSTGNIYVACSRRQNSPWDSTKDDALLLKFGAGGSLDWARVFDLGSADYGYGIAVDSGGNPCLSGTAALPDAFHTFVARFDQSGTLSWSRTFSASVSMEGGRAVACRPGTSEVYIGVNGWWGVTVFRMDGASGSLTGCGQYGGSFGPVRKLAVDTAGDAVVLGISGSALSPMYVGLFNSSLSVAGGWPITYDSGERDGGFTANSASLGFDSTGNVYLGFEIDDETFCGFAGTASVEDVGLVKFSPSGVLTWGRVWDTPAHVEPVGIQADGAGNMLFGARFGDKSGLMKYDASGNRLWTGYFTSSNPCVASLYPGGIAVKGGITYEAAIGAEVGGRGVMLVGRYDGAGSLLPEWDVTPFSTFWFTGGQVAADSGGNLLIAGTFYSTTTYTSELMVLKIDTAGTLLWTRTIGSGVTMGANAITVDQSDNAYVLFDDGGIFEAGLMKVNPLGQVQWIKDYPGTTGRREGVGIVAGTDRLYMVGSEYNGTGLDGVILKMDLNGSVGWTRKYPGVPRALFCGIIRDGVENAFLSGYVTDSLGNADMLAVSYDSVGNLRWSVPYGVGSPERNFIGLGSIYIAATTEECDQSLLVKYTEGPAAYLQVFLSGLPASVKQGASFQFSLSVLNTGEVTANAVTPSLSFSPATGARITVGPAPSQVTSLPPGEATVFVWSVEALQAGTLQINAAATGTDALSLDTVTAQSSASVEVKKAFTRAFTEEVVVYPNPVTGDVLNVALGLDEDAAEVRIEVYNVALQRVYTGRWRDVGASQAEVAVSGVGKWAAGGYLFRIEATLASGKRKKFPVTKVVVKR